MPIRIECTYCGGRIMRDYDDIDTHEPEYKCLQCGRPPTDYQLAQLQQLEAWVGKEST